MANLGDMVVKILADVSDFDKKLGAAETKMKDTAKNLQSLGTKLSLAVTLPIIGIGVAAVKSSANMEMLDASFTTMLGSASKATKLMTDLRKMGASTPFETTDLANASKTLLAYRISAEKILPTLSMLGDIAGGNSQKLGTMAEVFGRVTANGRLQGEELNRLIDVGFNPLAIIAEKTGKTMAELRKQMEQGGITTAMVTDAFQTATSAGGQFYKGMETASKTFTGLMSTLQDDVSTLGRSFVSDLMPGIKETVKSLSAMAQRITAMDPESKKMVLGVSLIAASIGPLLTVLAQIPKLMHGAEIATKAFNATLGFFSANPVILAMLAIAAGVAVVAAGLKKAKIESENFDKAMRGIADIETMRSVIKERQLQLDISIANQASAATRIGKEAAQAGIDAQKDTLRQLGQTLAAKQYNIEAARIQGEVAAEEAAREETRKQAELAALTAKNATEKKAADDELARIKAEEEAAKKAAEAEAEMVRIYLAEQTELKREAMRAGISITEEETEAKIIERKLSGDYADDFRREQIKADNAASKETVKITKEEVTEKTSIISNYVSELDSIFSGYYKNQDDLLDQQTDATISALDKQQEAAEKAANIATKALEKANDEILIGIDTRLQAELAAAGLADLTAVENAQKRLDKAIASGDAEAILEAQNALKKAQIIEKYAEERDKAEKAITASEKADAEARLATEEAYEKAVLAAKKDAAQKAYEIELKAFRTNQAFSLVQIALDTAMAVAKVWGQTGIGGLIAQVAPIAMGLIQAGIVSRQVPPAPPALAEGGIVMPRTGGVIAQIAEAGSPEVVFPLDKLESFLSGSSANSQFGNEGMLHLQVMLDSKPFLDKIFPATRNGTVLISGRAVI